MTEVQSLYNIPRLPAVLLAAERDRAVGPRPRRGSSAARAGVIVFSLLALMIDNIIRFQFAFRTSSRSLRVNMPFFAGGSVLSGSFRTYIAWRSVAGAD
ncbi:MAG: hypothetical protein ACKPKO_33325, partial [Candidatus Fonsibacter sp.]